jgi:hypothetical protein
MASGLLDQSGSDLAKLTVPAPLLPESTGVELLAVSRPDRVPVLGRLAGHPRRPERPSVDR